MRNPIRWFPDLSLRHTFIHSYTHIHTQRRTERQTGRQTGCMSWETFQSCPPDLVKHITLKAARLLCIIAEWGHCLCVNNPVFRAYVNSFRVFLKRSRRQSVISEPTFESTHLKIYNTINQFVTCIFLDTKDTCLNCHYFFILGLLLRQNEIIHFNISAIFQVIFYFYFIEQTIGYWRK